MVLPSPAPPPPGMLLLQHRCQCRGRVCVHCSWGFPSSLCLALWGNFALSSAQGLSPFPSLPVFPHSRLDFPKKSPCLTTLGCCPSLVRLLPARESRLAMGRHESNPVWEAKCLAFWVLPCLQLTCPAQQWLLGEGDHAPAPVALAPFPQRRELTHREGGCEGRHVAPGAACLLRRKQGHSCSRVAQVSGSTAPALRRGLEHLGEQAWRRHLAEEFVFLNSLLLGLGSPPMLPPAQPAQC